MQAARLFDLAKLACTIVDKKGDLGNSLVAAVLDGSFGGRHQLIDEHLELIVRLGKLDYLIREALNFFFLGTETAVDLLPNLQAGIVFALLRRLQIAQHI